jgi:hypothetical protein
MSFEHPWEPFLIRKSSALKSPYKAEVGGSKPSAPTSGAERFTHNVCGRSAPARAGRAGAADNVDRVPGMIEDPAGADPASPKLDAEQLATLTGFGERRAVRPGDVLFAEGDPGYDFFVVLSGAVDIIGTYDGVEEILVTHDAGRFLGELNLLTGQRVYLTARVAVAGEVVAIPVAQLRPPSRRSPTSSWGRWWPGGPSCWRAPPAPSGWWAPGTCRKLWPCGSS